jgi:hypothetical protein
MKTPIKLFVLCMLTSSQFLLAVCNEPQPRLVCAEYSASKTVVESTLMRVENVLYQNDPKSVLGSYYVLKTNRVYRGTADRTIRVYEENDSGRSTFSWKVGKNYLLFLRTSLEEPNDPALVLDGCGNSGPVARSRRTLREVEILNEQRNIALIAGRVSYEGLSAPLQGITVIARGNGKNYRVLTSKKGNFRITVPPGIYSLTPEDPHLAFKVSELSYEVPESLKMQSGSCVQVQFESVGHP